MRHSISLLCSAALLAIALPLAAQEAPPPADAEAEAAGTEQEAAAPEAGAEAAEQGTGVPALDMGTPVEGGEPQPGQPYIREEFGDWAMRCIRAAEGADPCELYQLLLSAEGNPVAEISLFPLPPGGQAAAGATVVAPLETLLTEGLTLSIDGGTPRQYEFSFCNRAGCIARIGLTADDVTAFKRGNAATLRIVPALDPSQPFDLTVSLTGFTAGYDGTEVYDPAEAEGGN